MSKAKNPDSLIFKKTIDRGNIIFFTFENNDAIVSISKSTLNIMCTCYNGSNMGCNNEQLCYHKKHILNRFKIDIEKFKKNKTLLNFENDKIRKKRIN